MVDNVFDFTSNESLTENNSSDEINLPNEFSLSDFDPISHTDYRIFDFEERIDADNNFFNQFQVNCQHYTDDKFKDIKLPNKGLSIIHFNVRSLSANFSSLSDYLNTLGFHFDIIALSETWLNMNSNSNLYSLPGYDFCHVDRCDKRGGGVAFYIKNSLKYNLVGEMCTTIDDVIECITIELFLSNKKRVIISCLYRPPGSPFDIFNETIEKLFFNKKQDLFLCGDFNTNLLDYTSHSVINFVNNLFGLGIFPLIDKPTRITRLTASLIDNIFTNVLNKNITSGIFITDVSDHFPVFYYFRV